MAYPITTELTLPAAISDGITVSQVLTVAGGLTIGGSLASGNVANLVTPQRVFISSLGNDTGVLWTVTGTNRIGNPLTESVAGANATPVYTTQDFMTVTGITGSAPAASTVTAGTGGYGSSVWVPWDVRTAVRFLVSVVGTILSGTPTWTVEYTLDDVYGTFLPASIPWPRPTAWTALTAKVGSADDVISRPVRATRLTLTAAGGARIVQLQQGT